MTTQRLVTNDVFFFQMLCNVFFYFVTYVRDGIHKNNRFFCVGKYLV